MFWFCLVLVFMLLLFWFVGIFKGIAQEKRIRSHKVQHKHMPVTLKESFEYLGVRRSGRKIRILEINIS